MATPDHHEITALLDELSTGGRAAVDALLPLVYDELHGLASRQLRGERPDHTLNATALVHEAYLKLADQRGVSWKNRAHFLGVASLAMRRLLINHAHRHLADKRGGGAAILTYDDDLASGETRAEELLAVNDALDRLAELSERQSKVVECRFFGGLTDQEIAEALGISVPTVRRDWRLARAWLAKELR